MEPGLYLPAVTVTDIIGNTYTATVLVNVLDAASMDDLFKRIWNGMKTSLQTGDTAGALNYFIPGSRDKYSAAFSALQSAVPQIANDMKDIEQVYVSNNVTKYRIKRDQVIDGQYKTVSYYIYFVRDQDGQWKLDEF